MPGCDSWTVLLKWKPKKKKRADNSRKLQASSAPNPAVHLNVKNYESIRSFTGKRIQEWICVVLNIFLFIFNFYHMCVNFQPENWYIVLTCAGKYH